VDVHLGHTPRADIVGLVDEEGKYHDQLAAYALDRGWVDRTRQDSTAGTRAEAAMPPNPAGGEAPLRIIPCYKDQGDDVANATRVPMNLLGKSQTFGGQCRVLSMLHIQRHLM
jgi:hypothetical protein